MNLTDPITDILVVDDDKLVSLVVSAGLRRKTALPVTPHSNGKSALDQVTATPAKIFMVLLDLNMPVMNGWEFLEEITRRGLTNVRVVIISSSVNLQDKSRAYSFPQVIDFLEKPVGEEQFSKLALLLEKV